MSTTSTKSISPSSRLIAACCGPTITTWDCNKSPSLEETSCVYTPLAGQSQDDCVEDIAWNHNGQVLACCFNNSTSAVSNVHSTIVLSNAHNGAQLDSFTSNSSKSKQRHSSSSNKSSTCTSIDFGGRSRYLSASSTNGTVAVWDLKKRSRVRLFSNITNVANNEKSGSPRRKGVMAGFSKACFDPTDSHIAAVSSAPNAALSLFKLRENVLVNTYISPAESYGGGTALQFSHIEPNLVAIGTKNGTVLVWDMNTGKDISTNNSPSSLIENCHSGIVTDLSFSPINRLLLATSSSDGIIAFHDCESGKTIQQLKPHSSGAINSLALHADGITCAAGTSSGHLLLYDLRKATVDGRPLASYSLSIRYPVKSVQFQSSSNNLALTNTSNQQQPTQTHRCANGQPENNSNINQPTKTPTKIQSAGGKSDSPLRKVTSQTNSPNASPEYAKKSNGSNQYDSDTARQTNDNPKPKTRSTLSSTYVNGHDTYSSASERKKEHIQSRNSSTDPRPTKSGSPRKFIDNLGSPKSIDSTSKIKQTNPSYLDHVEKEKIKNSKNKMTSSQSSSSPSNSTKEQIMELQQENNIGLNDNEKEGKYSDSSPQHNSKDFSSKYISGALQRVRKRFSPGQFSQRNKDDSVSYINNNDTIEEESEEYLDNGAQNSPRIRNSEMIQVDKVLIQNMINDAVDNLRDDVENSLQDLHVDILRQFENQSVELQELFQQQKQMLEEIMKENRLLREENERLRSVY